MLTPQEQQIDFALQANVAALRDSLFDLLAGLLLVVIALVSIVHSIFRIMFSSLGLVLWALGLLTIWLYSIRGWAVSRSSSSLHRWQFLTHENDY